MPHQRNGDGFGLIGEIGQVCIYSEIRTSNMAKFELHHLDLILLQFSLNWALVGSTSWLTAAKPRHKLVADALRPLRW